MSEFAKVDAVDRSRRSLIQGALWDVVIAVCAAMLVWLPDADISSREGWIVFGTALAKTVLTALASYVMRVREG